jgi:cathepsin L
MLGFVEDDSLEKEYTVFEEANADSVDWVTAGAVTPVKDQGQCGSCWAFSSTGALEGAHFVASKELLSFSEQQLVDCAGARYGNMGCNGGMQARAFKYLESHNAELESVYPYTSGTSKKKGSCKYSKSSTTAVDVSKYTNVT